MVFGMLDIYLSSVSYRLNEVMKVLTIISTIFIPLTFLVGVYGMNFKHMPELDQPWAYPALWIVMTAIALCMLAYFKKKKWF
jgi:magnesium transporter